MSTIDTVIVFRILKKLTTPFDKTPAYKLGLIDKKGKKIKNAETDEEKRAMTLLDRLVLNLKRLLAKVPGGRSQLATYIAALKLIQEHVEDKYGKETSDYLIETLNERKVLLPLGHDISTKEGYLAAMEEAIMHEMNSGAALGGSFSPAMTNTAANATGMAAPTGPTKKKRKLDKIVNRL